MRCLVSSRELRRVSTQPFAGIHRDLLAGLVALWRWLQISLNHRHPSFQITNLYIYVTLALRRWSATLTMRRNDRSVKKLSKCWNGRHSSPGNEGGQAERSTCRFGSIILRGCWFSTSRSPSVTVDVLSCTWCLHTLHFSSRADHYTIKLPWRQGHETFSTIQGPEESLSRGRPKLVEACTWGPPEAVEREKQKTKAMTHGPKSWWKCKMPEKIKLRINSKRVCIYARCL